MEKCLDITMACGDSGRWFIKRLRLVIAWSRRYYGLEDYRLAGLGLKRFQGYVRCRIVFAPK